MVSTGRLLYRRGWRDDAAVHWGSNDDIVDPHFRPLVIESDNCRLGKVPKKARALLAFLAAQRGQTVSRERLADLLWPYQGSGQARHGLRNCLLELRKALGHSATEHLVADFANCRLQTIVADLQNFERLSRS